MKGDHECIPVSPILGEAEPVEHRADLPLRRHNHGLGLLLHPRHRVVLRCARWRSAVVRHPDAALALYIERARQPDVLSKTKEGRADLAPLKPCRDVRQSGSVAAGVVPVSSLFWKNRVCAFMRAGRRRVPARGGLEVELVLVVGGGGAREGRGRRRGSRQGVGR